MVVAGWESRDGSRRVRAAGWEFRFEQGLVGGLVEGKSTSAPVSCLFLTPTPNFMKIGPKGAKLVSGLVGGADG